jgi:hypothetical protein
MKHHRIATIVNFCSNESRFIGATLNQALLFSKQIIVPVCDHFFDGTKENREILDKVYRAFPECQFIEYPFFHNGLPRKIWKKLDPTHFWHSLSRLIGYSQLDEDIDTVLFLDADEVPDGKRFIGWLENSDYRHHTALKMANYWYFREPVNQANVFEDVVVLAQRRALSPEIILHQNERDAIYNLVPGPKRRLVTDFEGLPMFHHYSWVRTQEEMLKKVRSWSRKYDRDWVSLVEKEFLSPFQGTDFVHGYSFKTVKCSFNINLDQPSFEYKGQPRVNFLGAQDILDLIKIERSWNFLDFKRLFRR